VIGYRLWGRQTKSSRFEVEEKDSKGKSKKVKGKSEDEGNKE